MNGGIRTEQHEPCDPGDNIHSGTVRFGMAATSIDPVRFKLSPEVVQTDLQVLSSSSLVASSAFVHGGVLFTFRRDSKTAQSCFQKALSLDPGLNEPRLKLDEIFKTNKAGGSE